MTTHMAGMTFGKMPFQRTKKSSRLKSRHKPHPQLRKSLSMSKRLDVKTMPKSLLPLWVFNQINLFFFFFFNKRKHKDTFKQLKVTSTEHYSKKIHPVTSGKQTILVMTFFFFRREQEVYMQSKTQPPKMLDCMSTRSRFKSKNIFL